MFRKSGKAWAYQWSAVSCTWVEIGEVTGTGTENRGIVDGVAYDMVIPVEIENPRTGGIQKLQIGYNQGGKAAHLDSTPLSPLWEQKIRSQ